MSESTLFYIIFINQIIIFSWYFPSKILERMRTVIKNYPPTDYPRLYVKPIEFYIKWHSNYQLINYLILALGFFILAILLTVDFKADEYISEVFPWAYFMVQILPVIFIEVSSYSYFRKMRASDNRKTRKAELNPRRFLDFVSPVPVIIAVILLSAAISTDVFINIQREKFQFDISNASILRAIALILTNLFFIAIVFWNLHGKKLDPYQAKEDRFKQIESTIKSLIYVSIGMSLFYIINEFIDNNDYEHYKPVLMSIYLQGIAFASLWTMMRSIKIEDINFDVYKA